MTDDGEHVLRRRDVAVALTLAVAAALVFVSHACPTVYWYDSAEYLAAAMTGGIPHPPGYPVYTAIAHAVTWLPIDAARAVNGLSSVFAGACVGWVFVLARQLGAAPWAAVVGAAWAATNPVLWRNAIIAESVVPGLFGALAVMSGLLAIRASGTQRLWPIALVSTAAGLWLGVHYAVATCGLGFALLVVMGPAPGDRGLAVGSKLTLALRRGGWRRVGVSVMGVTLGFALVLVWLAAKTVWVDVAIDGNVYTWERYVWLVRGGNYGSLFLARVEHAERLAGFAALVRDCLGWPGLLAVAAALVMPRADRIPVAAIMFAVLGNLWFFYDYAVHDVEAFVLPGVTFALCLVGVGLTRVCDHIPTRWRRVAAVALVLAFGVGVFERARTLHREADLSEARHAERYGEMMVARLPRGAVVVTFTTPGEWQMHTVFARYFVGALGARPDVEIHERPSLESIATWIGSHKAVYTYLPLPFLSRHFLLQPEGPAVRIRGGGMRDSRRRATQHAAPMR